MILKRNLLKEIFEKKLTEDEADEFIGKVLDSNQANQLSEIITFDKYEYTAFAHGSGLAELAHWRYKGWPECCAICRNRIVKEQFGWKPKEIDGKTLLTHIGCNPDTSS